MSDPYLAEIRLMSFAFAPQGWAACDGQLLPINQNQPLFALLGTTYGGDGVTTFALPDLRGRVPVGAGNAFILGQAAGAYSRTLTLTELPAHTHIAGVAAAAAVQTPNGTTYLAQPGKAAFAATAGTTLHPETVASVGSSQPHENTAPYLTLQFAIALQGIFPSQN